MSVIRDITFADWVKNPSETRSRIVGEKDIAKAVYGDKFNKMLLLCAGKIDYYLFHEDTKKFVIYIKMPSDSIKGLTYDVVIEFTTDKENNRRINNLNDYHVKFFANDPNFVFTYAYAYNKNGLLIPSLRYKMSQKALSTKPKVTNPNALVGYAKYIYFAYLFMQNRGLFNKLNWLNADTIDHLSQFLNKNIMNADDKIKQAQNLKTIIKNKGRIANINDKNALEKSARTTEHIVAYQKKVSKVRNAVKSKFASKASTAKVVNRKR